MYNGHVLRAIVVDRALSHAQLFLLISCPILSHFCSLCRFHIFLARVRHRICQLYVSTFEKIGSWT